MFKVGQGSGASELGMVQGALGVVSAAAGLGTRAILGLQLGNDTSDFGFKGFGLLGLM